MAVVCKMNVDAVTFHVGDNVVPSEKGRESMLAGGLYVPLGPGRIEHVTGSPYVGLPLGVRWYNWKHGHNLERDGTTSWGGGGWWCAEAWLIKVTREEVVLWLLAK